jgi:hypothetical protein
MHKQRRALENNKGSPPTTLYRVVFDSKPVKYAVGFLLCFLLIQPIAPAFADEVEGGVSDTPAVSVDTESESESETDSSVSETVEEEVTAPEVTEPESTEVIAEVSEVEALPLESNGEGSENEEELPQEEPVTPEVVTHSTATSTEPLPTENATTTEETPEIVEPTGEVPAEENEEVEEVEEVPTTPVATSSATTTVNQPEVPLIFEAHNDNTYEFDTTQCAAVGDGSYYCSDTKDIQDPLKDGVFAAPDSGGDLEIFVRLNGEEEVLTHNEVDDASPYYDAASNRIVWHTLKNDRYQIVSYDLKEDELSTLTDTNYNNMEPVAFGELTLWQAWIDNNWEIMLYDGSATTRLTTNALQDVSPSMRGGYIIWQTQFTDGWQVALYNQETKSIEYIKSDAGMSVENPRFVLIYDSTNKQGDVQTVGYDLDSKETFTLGSVPAELPDELPDPDQTGETRALIQNKQTAREGENEVIDVPSPTTGTSTPPTATSTPGTIDMTGGTVATSSVPILVPEAVDVVIPPFATTTPQNPDVVDIPDVVIPPASGTTTDIVS